MTVQQYGNDFVSDEDPGRLSLSLLPSLVIVAEREKVSENGKKQKQMSRIHIVCWKSP